MREERTDAQCQNYNMCTCWTAFPPWWSIWQARRYRTRIRTMTQTMTVTDAKARLSELVAMVERTQEHVAITRNGEPAAVLVSHAELEALRETIAILSDATLIVDIRQAEADIAAGNTVNAEDLRESMQARRPTRA